MEHAQKKIANGILWSATERFSTQIFQFIITVIMARILVPSDFGLIGMLAIFFSISQTFIDSGFSKALIQKYKPTENDFSTVFFFNIALAVLFYVCFFFLAPAISRFYNVAILEPLVKVLALNLIITSFSIIQRAKITIALDFKFLSKASWLSVIAGGIIGIVLAAIGFGVWSIAIQSIMTNMVMTMVLWRHERWLPLKTFSRESFARLFAFGSNLLIASIIYTVFDNLYSLIIGKKYNAAILGYYDKAKHFAQLPSLSIASVIQRATLPVFSQIQDNRFLLCTSFRRLIRLTSFTVMPLMLLLAVIAHPLINILLSEKWLPAAPFFQLLCMVMVWFPMDELNVNLITSTGDTALVLKLEIVKKAIALGLLVMTLPHGIVALIIGQLVSSTISLALSMYFGGRKIGYNFGKQLADMLPFAGLSLITAAMAYGAMALIQIQAIQIVVACTVLTITYIGFSYLVKMPELADVIRILERK